MIIKHVIFFSTLVAASMPSVANADVSRIQTVTYSTRLVYPNGKPAADAKLLVCTVDDTTKATATLTRKPDTTGKVTFVERPNPLDIIQPNVSVYAMSPSGIGFIGSQSSTVTLHPFTKVRIRFIDNNGKPVPHILVAPMMFIGSEPLKWNVAIPCRWRQTTDDTGCVTLDNLPQGYKLVMGVDDVHYFCTDQQHGFDLAKSPNTPDTTVQVLPAQSMRGQVVCKSTGKPLPGIHVVAHTSAFSIGEAISDASGNFTIGGLPPAAYTVCQPDDPDGTVDWISNPQSAVVKNGEDCTGVKLSLFHGGLVTGKITDPITGKPVRGVTVWANLDSNVGGRTNPSYVSVKAGQDGAYRLRFTPGKATIHSNPDFSTDETIPEKQVVVKEGETKVINFHVKVPTRLHGIVIGPNGIPAAGAVVLENMNPGLVTIKTDSQGRFEFDRPIQGEVINFEAEFGTLGSPRPTIYKRQNPIILSVKPGKLSTIIGRVIDAEGKPVAGATANLCFWIPDTLGGFQYSRIITYTTFNEAAYTTFDEAAYTTFDDGALSTDAIAMTDAHGRYHFKSIFGDTAYRVLIKAPGYVGSYSKGVAVKAGRTAEIPPTRLTAGTYIGGMVVNSTGEPIANAEVIGQSTDYSIPNPNFAATTDLTGRFLIQSIAKKQIQFTVLTWQGQYGPYTFLPGRKDYVLKLKPESH